MHAAGRPRRAADRLPPLAAPHSSAACFHSRPPSGHNEDSRMYRHRETFRREPGVVRSELRLRALPAPGIVWAPGEAQPRSTGHGGGSELPSGERPAGTQSSRWTDGTLPAGVSAGVTVALRRACSAKAGVPDLLPHSPCAVTAHHCPGPAGPHPLPPPPLPTLHPLLLLLPLPLPGLSVRWPFAREFSCFSLWL